MCVTLDVNLLVITIGISSLQLEQSAAPQSEAEDPIDAHPPPESSTEPNDVSQYSYSQAQPGTSDPLSSGDSRYSNNLRPPPPPLSRVWPQGPSRPAYQPGWYANPSPLGPSFSPYLFGGASGASPYTWSTGYSPQVFPRSAPFPFHSGAANEGLGFQNQAAHSRDFRLNSPSGATSLSVQVQAPSSPPTHSPPSANNNNNNTAATGQTPALSTVTQSSLPLGVSVSSLAMRTSDNLLSKMPNSSEGAAGDNGQDEESMSSLPVSVPDDHDL